MDEDKALQRFRAGLFASSSAMFGLLSYLAAMVITMLFVPRRAEGIRDVVDLAWPTYALLPTFLSFAALLMIAPMMPSQRSRYAFIAVFTLAIAGCTFFGIDILRRDYIGKL